MTVVALAASNGHQSCVETLLEYGVDPNIPDKVQL